MYSRDQYESDFIDGRLLIFSETIVDSLDDNRSQEEKELVIDEYKRRLLYYLWAKAFDSIVFLRADILVGKESEDIS